MREYHKCSSDWDSQDLNKKTLNKKFRTSAWIVFGFSLGIKSEQDIQKSSAWSKIMCDSKVFKDGDRT